MMGSWTDYLLRKVDILETPVVSEIKKELHP